MTAASENLVSLGQNLFTKEQIANISKFDVLLETKPLPPQMVQQIKDGVIDLSWHAAENVSARSFHATYAALHGAGEAPQCLIAVRQRRKGPSTYFELSGFVGFGKEVETAIRAMPNTYPTKIAPNHLFTMLFSNESFLMDTPTLPRLFGTKKTDIFQRLGIPDPKVTLQALDGPK